MKWYYYYHHTQSTRYNIPMWEITTRVLVHWRNTFNDHIIDRETTYQTDFHPRKTKRFPSTQQPNAARRYRILHKMDAWLLLFQRELDRRDNNEYRAFINSIIHKPQEKFTSALVFADWCDEHNMFVLGRQLRKWSSEEQEICFQANRTYKAVKKLFD